MIIVKKLLKKLLYISLYYTRLLDLIVKISLIVNTKNKCLILFYHRFCAENYETKLLSRLSASEFDRQLKYLTRIYDVISLDEAVNKIKSEKAFHKPSIVLTIDDGYKDNYSLAFPVLTKYGVKATIYLTTGVIGTPEGLWLDDLEFALLHAKTDTIKLPEIFGDELINVSTLNDKQIILKRLYNLLLPCTNFRRQDCIAQVVTALGVSPSDIASRERVMLTWDEVREMAASGICFEAHTVTHPFLPILPIEEAQREIMDSRTRIQDEIGMPVKHFAIPNGARSDFTDRLTAYCRDMEFVSVVTTEGGTVDICDDLYRLKRVLPPPPTYYFACEIAKYLFFSK